ncbi:MAG: hypothetical protein IPJ00_21700 [Saprospirales bacterium]|nr:hypothetical protein [Saprospirales bacterium]
MTLEGQSFCKWRRTCNRGRAGFKNGYTPVSEVIAFRKSKEELRNCRVTECVVDN